MPLDSGILLYFNMDASAAHLHYMTEMLIFLTLKKKMQKKRRKKPTLSRENFTLSIMLQRRTHEMPHSLPPASLHNSIAPPAHRKNDPA